MAERTDVSGSGGVVLSEIEEWKNNPPNGETLLRRLNNFHTCLPNVDCSDRSGGSRRRMALDGGLIDIINGKSHRSAQEILLHSELYMGQTPREFFGEIDRTIACLPGISLARIIELQQRIEEYKDINFSRPMTPAEEAQVYEKIDRLMEARTALFEYCLPVYIELRIKGYSHFDLTC